MELLKESVADRGHDTTKSVDVKGPFLDPILGYDGGGELPTHKDASSILERYYFNQDSDKGVVVTSEEAEIRQVGDNKGALKDVPEDVDKSKKDAAKATELKEAEEGEELPDDGEEEDDSVSESDFLEDDVENAVIERLIAEMEEDADLLEEGDDMEDDDDDDDDDDAEEVKENSPPQDPAAKFHDPSGEPKKDSSGLVDGDDHKGGEKVVKAATFPAGSEGVGKGIKAAMKEGDEIVPGDEEEPTDEVPKKDIDLDKETGIKESGSPIGNPATADEGEPYENLDEQFEIFKEAIEEDDDDEDDDDKDDAPTFEKGKVPNFGKKDVKV
jgi:hypothetical protein